jgi:hypothetical protein
MPRARVAETRHRAPGMGNHRRVFHNTILAYFPGIAKPGPR